MAKATHNDLKGLSIEERSAKLAELRKELMKINAQIATGTTPKSPGQARSIKKTIARIHTINNTKEALKKE